MDFDIVNPYFRSSDYAEALKEKGVRLIAPLYAGSTADLPMIPPEIQSVFKGEGVVIIDVGGDDVGSRVLGSFADKIQKIDYDMLYVINKYRILSTTAEETVSLLREIELASQLKATGIVNNSHLMQDTTPAVISASLAYAEETSAAAGVPIRATVIPGFLADRLGPGYYPVNIYVHPPWVDGAV